MEGRSLRELTSSGSLKKVRSLSHKNTVCVLEAGRILNNAVLPLENGHKLCLARRRYLLGFLNHRFICWLFLRKCTDSLLLCHVYAVAFFFFLYGEYVVRYFPLLDDVYSILF